MNTDALLVLDDGTEFEGEAIGALRPDAGGVAMGVGEFVFNTSKIPKDVEVIRK